VEEWAKDVVHVLGEKFPFVCEIMYVVPTIKCCSNLPAIRFNVKIGCIEGSMDRGGFLQFIFIVVIAFLSLRGDRWEHQHSQ